MSAERLERRLVEHDLALLGMLLGGGELVDEPPGEHVDELDLGIADDESPGGADRHRDLHLDPHRGPAGRDGLAAARDRVLHREAACGCARAVVAVEPAGDPVAAEIDDVATEAIELVSERLEHAIQVGGQHLCSALRTELGGKRLGERREAGDVGEQGGAARRGRATPDRQRAPAGDRERCTPRGCRRRGVRSAARTPIIGRAPLGGVGCALRQSALVRIIAAHMAADHEAPAADGSDEVVVDGVTKRFDQLAVVRDVTLRIPRGEFFSMLGPSGCGKTTTLRMIAGFEHPSEGGSGSAAPT